MIQKEAETPVRISVLIPTYNNDKTLLGVLNDVKKWSDDIVVINDGSTDNTSSILASIEGIHVISNEKNSGKGIALRRGFSFCWELGYTHTVSIDSDGQHFAEDLPVFFNAIRKNPEALIVGVRNMNQLSVPGKSSFGKKFSNFWYDVETGIKLKDTQSGFRAYPLKKLVQKKWFTRKFEFEIEVLVRAAWSGVYIEEIPVQVYYADPIERVSHFRPIHDFVRISVLNTVLVTLALAWFRPRNFFLNFRKAELRKYLFQKLFNTQQSSGLKAFSIGFGVFMGIFPIWGFQLAVAIPLSIFFRLNTALVVLAAHISIPPMIPIILYVSHLTGKLWMGGHSEPISFSDKLTLATIGQFTEQYFLGAITLAAAAGIIFGLVSYILITLVKK
ncbi:MAG: DUF2062 domain-containing protein [Crocinitomicaceae bacterium]|nr:DUF2062 domain-containing protein [Crocinitomicaceae bacterium]